MTDARVMRVPVSLAAAAAGTVMGVKTFTWWRGDSRMVWMSGHLAEVDRLDGTLTGVIGIRNEGRGLGVVRRVDGHLVSGATGAVLATLQGSRPPERGWWVSNILKPGETCIAEIDVELVGPGTGPVIIALDAHEIGRRLLVHRRTRLTLPIGVPATPV